MSDNDAENSGDAGTFETSGMDKLVKALKNLPTCRVGILGNTATREPAKGQKKLLNNAELGAIYEFGGGQDHRPGGSFLRVPIADLLHKQLEASGALDKDVLKEVIKSGSAAPWMAKVGVVAEGVVTGAFDSGGYGKWKPSDMSKKKNAQTLVETTQLRESITSEVKEK